MKLSQKNLQNFIDKVSIPSYDRSAVTCGVVHMSVGGFHRSHQAVYMDDLLSQGQMQWGICGVGLLPNDAEHIKTLQAQDTLYSVLERNATEDRVRVVGSMIEVMHAPSDPQAVLKRLQDPAIKILSLTVTEKGYCYDNDNNLDQNNSLIQEDLKNLSAPKTALGYIVSALQLRKDSGQAAFAVMSCDNLVGNGDLTKKLVLQFSALVDEDLAQWIEKNVSFPNAMVDRITPVTTDIIVQTLAEKFNVEDGWPVVCEDFKQWVLEDDFCDGRPDFSQVGVQMVDDVKPYEKMKIRLLNGSHSALSYVSYLTGYREVDVAMSDPVISKFVRDYMDNDITASVPDVPGIDLEAYKDRLIERFANPAISDQILRLAEDGSQKIQNAILPCARYQLEKGASISYIAMALAGWFCYLGACESEDEIKDPMAKILYDRAIVDVHSPRALLEIEDIFGNDLISNDVFVESVTKAMASIHDKGMKEALVALG